MPSSSASSCGDHGVLFKLHPRCPCLVSHSTFPSGVTWWQLNAGGGWADGDYLEVCGGAGSNVFGVGLVSPGSDTQYDLVHGLAGDNGWIML